MDELLRDKTIGQHEQESINTKTQLNNALKSLQDSQKKNKQLRQDLTNIETALSITQIQLTNTQMELSDTEMKITNAVARLGDKDVYMQKLNDIKVELNILKDKNKLKLANIQTELNVTLKSLQDSQEENEHLNKI